MFNQDREVQRKHGKKNETGEVLRLLDFVSLLLANKADANLAADDELTPVMILAKNLEKYGIGEESIKAHPSGAVSKWKKIVIRAAQE